MLVDGDPAGVFRWGPGSPVVLRSFHPDCNPVRGRGCHTAAKPGMFPPCMAHVDLQEGLGRSVSGTAAPRSGGCLGPPPRQLRPSRPVIFSLMLQEHVRWCEMTSGTKTPTAWAVDETRRFFRAFHKHGTEFDKVGLAGRPWVRTVRCQVTPSVHRGHGVGMHVGYCSSCRPLAAGSLSTSKLLGKGCGAKHSGGHMRLPSLRLLSGAGGTPAAVLEAGGGGGVLKRHGCTGSGARSGGAPSDAIFVGVPDLGQQAQDPRARAHKQARHPSMWSAWEVMNPPSTALQVSRAVGSGRGAEQCEALYRQHQAYLSLDKKFQSEVAFIAMVQDATQHLLKVTHSLPFGINLF